MNWFDRIPPEMQCFCRFQTHGSPKNVPDPLRIPSGSPPDPHRIPRSGRLLKAPPKPGSREQNTEFGRDPRRDPPRMCPLVAAGAISQIVPSYLIVCNRQLSNVGTIWAEGFCAQNAWRRRRRHGRRRKTTATGEDGKSLEEEWRRRRRRRARTVKF